MTAPAVAVANDKPALDKYATDFLVKDYELKVHYLTDQFTRMWNRFNYFVAIQSALVGGKFFLPSDGKRGPGLAVIGAVLALVWYVMGAEDRYLVDVYRTQVKEAGERVARSLWRELEPYRYVGEIEQTSESIRPSITARITSWRLDAISTTRLAAWVPLLLTLTWIGVLIYGRH